MTDSQHTDEDTTTLQHAATEAVMLRRAAEACRNLQKGATGRRDWFDWVPQHLDQLAERIDPRHPDDRALPFVPRVPYGRGADR